MNLQGRRILVTEAGSAPGVTVVRSLGQRGAHVVAADCDADSPAFRSRYASATHRYTDPGQNPAACVEDLLGAVRRHRAELLVPLTDKLIVAVSDARHRFAGSCELALPSAAALETSRDKAATIALAGRSGVAVPGSRLVDTADAAAAAAGELGWPVVLKPRYSHGSAGSGRPLETFGVTVAADDRQVRQRMAAFEGRTDVLVQEFRPGEGVGVELLLHEGRPLAAFQHRRLRQVPVTGGTSSLRESVALEPELFETSVRLLGAMGWTGLAMVEFRVDRSGSNGRSAPSRAVLMEVNGRIWGSMALPVRAGMDFPARLAGLHLEGPPPPESPVDADYRSGVRVRNLGLEMQWAASVLGQRFLHGFEPTPRRSEAVKVLAGLAWPGNHFDVQVVDDPRPGLVDARHQARRLACQLATEARGRLEVKGRAATGSKT